MYTEKKAFKKILVAHYNTILSVIDTYHYLFTGFFTMEMKGLLFQHPSFNDLIYSSKIVININLWEMLLF